MKNSKKMDFARILFVVMLLITFLCSSDNNYRNQRKNSILYKQKNVHSTFLDDILHYKNDARMHTDDVYKTIPFTKTMMFFRADKPIK